MENFSPEMQEEIHHLTVRLGDRDRENQLLDLEKAFRQWKKGTLGFSELDHMLISYGHRKSNMAHGDPIVTIADALAEGTLTRSDVSDALYNRIEIVVRLMKN
ncbi:MAG: hypothetical protein JXA95_15150 [Spirochaetales bacterium]|nr:hypothetical protein [Spirochaetales bacterium]